MRDGGSGGTAAVVIGHRPATGSRSRGAELEDSFDRRSGTAKRITLVPYRVASQANHASRRVICRIICVIICVIICRIVHDRLRERSHDHSCVRSRVVRVNVHMIPRVVACMVVYKSSKPCTNLRIFAPVYRRRSSSFYRASVRLVQFAGIYERLFTNPRQRQLLATTCAATSYIDRDIWLLAPSSPVSLNGSSLA
jgi:hypothetical protein